MIQQLNMADDARPWASSSVETSSSPLMGGTTSAVTSSTEWRNSTGYPRKQNVKRKQYYKDRDATNDLKLKMDKELAAILLEFYVTKKKRIFR